MAKDSAPQIEGGDRDYLTVMGRVDTTKTFVWILLRAYWLVRLIYNATIDSHVPFEAGVEYRLAVSKAQSEGTDPPNPPTPSETFLPVPDAQDLKKTLTKLRARRPVLEELPWAMLARAIDDGCKARAKHVAACVKAKAEGKSLPKLKFRAADDNLDISSEAVRLYRCGRGEVSPRLVVGPGNETNRQRRKDKKAKREADWAERKRNTGWSEAKIELHLAERAARQERDRRKQAEHDAKLTGKPEGSPRRDSPKAIIGAERVKVEMKGVSPGSCLPIPSGSRRRRGRARPLRQAARAGEPRRGALRCQRAEGETQTRRVGYRPDAARSGEDAAG